MQLCVGMSVYFAQWRLLFAGSLFAGQCILSGQFLPAPMPEPQLGPAPLRPGEEEHRGIGPMRDSGIVGPAPFFSIDIHNREQVRLFYNAVFTASQDTPIEWTGDVDLNNPGTTAAAFKEAVALRVNYFRAMAGVPSVITFNDEYSRKDQMAALMMSANNALSHTPPDTWMDYTAEGAEAASHSNISLGHNGWDAVFGQMQDNGSNNSVAGHRRWILYPQTQTMGTGDVPEQNDYSAANALWVFDGRFGAARPSTREEFVSWPPPGFVPYPLIFARWSFAYPDADFSSATVTMTQNSTDIPINLEPVANGYGENTLVWVWNNLDSSTNPAPSAVTADTPVQVKIDHVMVQGTQRSFNYEVTIFDPATPGPGTVTPKLVSAPVCYVGRDNPITIAADPNATAWQWRYSTARPITDLANANNGLNGLLAKVSSGYELIATDVSLDGSPSYHLVQPDFKPQYLILDRALVPGTNSLLTFNSRLGWAMPKQIARVQVSIDGGKNWVSVYEQPGTGSKGETQFVLRTIDLSSFAFRSITLRFTYDFATGTAFTQTDTGVGWYINDVAISNTVEISDPVTNVTPLSANLLFHPATPGNYLLQVRPQLFGSYYLDWSPILEVAVQPGTSLPITLSISKLLPGNILEITLQGDTGNYQIQTSSNLVSWNYRTNASLLGTSVTISDTASANEKARYYRALRE